jgi:hypothetical protein
MHLFIGFIQLLLILTDSRMIPDMSAFWHDVVKEEKNKTNERKGLTLEYPSAIAAKVSFDILHRTGNDKMVLPANQANAKSIKIILNTLAPSPRVIDTSKLYLIFCQLKTEG